MLLSLSLSFPSSPVSSLASLTHSNSQCQCAATTASRCQAGSLLYSHPLSLHMLLALKCASHMAPTTGPEPNDELPTKLFLSELTGFCPPGRPTFNFNDAVLRYCRNCYINTPCSLSNSSSLLFLAVAFIGSLLQWEAEL